MRKHFRRIIACTLALTMVLTGSLWANALGVGNGSIGAYESYAATDSGEPADPDTAKAAMDAAKDVLEAKEAAMDQAEQALNGAKADQETADSEEAQAKAAAENAETALDYAIADIQQAAQEAYDEAYEANEAAQNAKTDAEQALTDAQTAKDQADAAVTAAESDLTAKTSAVSTAESNLTTANSNYASAVAQWEADQATAAENLQTAEAAYNSCGRDFIDSKVDASLTSSKWDTWLRTYMKDKSFTNSSGNTVNWNDYLGTDEYKAAIASQYTYENLKNAALLVEEGNALRKSQDSSLSALKIDYNMINLAIASLTLSSKITGHVLWNDADFAGDAGSMKSGTLGQYGSSGENLAWGSATPYDPFMGWYYEEKVLYLAIQADYSNPKVTSAILQTVEDEAANNGHNFEKYYKTYYRTRDRFIANLNDELAYGPDYYDSITGHYTSLINSNFKATGLAFNTKSPVYGNSSSQEFSSNVDSADLTPEQFIAALDAYCGEAKAAYEEALQRVEELKSAPQAVQDADQAVKAAAAALNQAKADKTAAEQALAQAQQQAANAQATVQEKTAAAQEAANAAESAQTQEDQAQAALTKADAIDADDPESFADYDEIVSLADALADANTAYAQKQQAAADAAAQVTLLTASYETAVTDYNDAKDAYDKAKAAYEKIYAEYDLSQMTASGIKDKTYTGKELTQDITITDKNGNVIPADVYEITYKNNVNAGKATVTIAPAETAGYYHGSLEKTFTISKATQKITTTKKTVTLKKSTLKKKALSFKLSKGLAAKAKGKISYKFKPYNSKAKKVLSYKSGKIKVKKGTKKGTYKAVITVSAKATTNYKAASKKVTISVKVK